MQRFTTQEIREVLGRAVEQQEEQGQDTRLGFEDLLAAAREVGVSEEVLREASRDLRARAEASAAVAGFEAWKRKKRRAFWRHFGIYAVVCSAFLIFGLVVRSSMVGMIQIPLWWGIGIGIHALGAFMANEDDYKEKVEKEEQRDRRRRRRREVVSRAVDEGAKLLVDTGATLRQRIQMSRNPAVVQAEAARRVRIVEEAAEAAAEAAEAEAEAAAERAERTRR
jgi:serine/threonine-protein kinase